jgi:hypothetical protein
MFDRPLSGLPWQPGFPTAVGAGALAPPDIGSALGRLKPDGLPLAGSPLKHCPPGGGQPLRPEAYAALRVSTSALGRLRGRWPCSHWPEQRCFIPLARNTALPTMTSTQTPGGNIIPDVFSVRRVVRYPPLTICHDEINPMSALTTLLNTYRNAAVSEREKGTYFEELMIAYLRNEATYRDLYSNVWTYAEWATLQKLDKRDTGIDLVAITQGTNEFHAIQCKFYAEDYRIQKGDIDSFFTASGKSIFKHRIIVSTTSNWSEHANDALQDQNPPVSKIDLYDLENSQIDWAQYQPGKAPLLHVKKALRPHQQNALNAVMEGFKTAERGKLIMACGTGKTFTSLKIAEALAGAGGRVLFLVPSLSLLSQTLTEWTQESQIPLHSFAVCSDSDVGKKRKVDDDVVQTFTHELRYPATTQPAKLASEMAPPFRLRLARILCAPLLLALR